MSVTPLLRFMRALTPEQRAEFARLAGTTTMYLYQLSAQKEPNPRLRLALALVEESKKLARRVKVPAITLEDLTIGPDD